MWLVFAFLTLLAAIFIIIPLLKNRIRQEIPTLRPDDKIAENILAFKDQQAELDFQLAGGVIDDTEYSELLLEQKRILLLDAVNESKYPKKEYADRGAWIILLSLLLTPIFVFSLYHYLGASADLNITDLLKKRASIPMNDIDRKALSKKIQKKMSSRLLSEPDHPFYLVTLAQLQMEDGNFRDAQSSYFEALNARPNDSELMSEYAQATYFLEDKKFSEKVNLILDDALSLNPSNPIALGLQGIRYFESNSYKLAIKSWKNALLVIPANTAEADALKSGISYAQKLLKEDIFTLSIKISVSPEYKITKGQVMYVYAKEWGGEPKPLAAIKLLVGDFPATVILDDTMSMMGGKILSSVDFLEIFARVSVSGSATPSHGDYQGSTGKIKVQGSRTVKIQIDKKI